MSSCLWFWGKCSRHMIWLEVERVNTWSSVVSWQAKLLRDNRPDGQRTGKAWLGKHHMIPTIIFVYLSLFILFILWRVWRSALFNYELFFSTTTAAELLINVRYCILWYFFLWSVEFICPMTRKYWESLLSLCLFSFWIIHIFFLLALLLLKCLLLPWCPARIFISFYTTQQK